MLSNNDRKLYERYVDSRDNFSLMSSNDPSTRRDVKIARFKQEQELKLKLEASVVQSLNGVVSNEPHSSLPRFPWSSMVMMPPSGNYTWPKLNSASTMPSMPLTKRLKS